MRTYNSRQRRSRVSGPVKHVTREQDLFLKQIGLSGNAFGLYSVKWLVQTPAWTPHYGPGVGRAVAQAVSR
jgi:hypothetical protein